MLITCLSMKLVEDEVKNAFYNENKCMLNSAMMKLYGCFDDVHAWLKETCWKAWKKLPWSIRPKNEYVKVETGMTIKVEKHAIFWWT